MQQPLWMVWGSHLELVGEGQEQLNAKYLLRGLEGELHVKLQQVHHTILIPVFLSSLTGEANHRTC